MGDARIGDARALLQLEAKSILTERRSPCLPTWPGRRDRVMSPPGDAVPERANEVRGRAKPMLQQPRGVS
jgi:hypothetical protein